MKKQVKIIIAAILGLAGAGSVAASVMAPLTVDVTTLYLAAAKVTFTEQGSYVYDRSFTVYPQIAGEVLEIKVRQGDNVKQGDVIAIVSATDYEYQIKALESNIEGYKAQINNLYAQEKEGKDALYSSRETLLGQIAEIDTNLKGHELSRDAIDRQIEIQEDILTQNEYMVRLARSDIRMVKDNYDDGIIEENEYNTQRNAAREKYTQAEIALEASRQQLEQLKAGNVTKEGFLKQRDSLENQLGLIEDRLNNSGVWAMRQYYNAMIEGTKQNIESMGEKLGNAAITAPVSGVIDKLPVRDSNIITQAGSIATISSDPFVEVFVPIREIDGVHIGDTAELIMDKRLGNETLTATVAIIEDKAQIKVSALGVEERKVRVLLKPKENNLRIGYGMDVRFTVFEQPEAVIIPKTAVFEKDGKDMVWIAENDTAALREIEKGIETRDGYAVNSGLSSGDTIITDANVENLKEGKNIKAA